MRQIKNVYLTLEVIVQHPSEGVSIEIQILKVVTLHSFIHLYNILEHILDTRRCTRPEDRRVKSSCFAVGKEGHMYEAIREQI